MNRATNDSFWHVVHRWVHCSPNIREASCSRPTTRLCAESERFLEHSELNGMSYQTPPSRLRIYMEWWDRKILRAWGGKWLQADSVFHMHEDRWTQELIATVKASTRPAQVQARHNQHWKGEVKMPVCNWQLLEKETVFSNGVSLKKISQITERKCFALELKCGISVTL